MIRKIEMERFSLTTSKRFDEVISSVNAAVGHPDMADLNGNFSFSWCSHDAFTSTSELFFTPGSTESFAFAIFDTTASSNLLTMSSSDFSTLSGTWQAGPAFTCAAPSGNLTWTAVKN
jgi:hypothetical protein